jgi:hypothetical protein
MAIGGSSNIFGSNNSSNNTGGLFGSLMPKTASSAASSPNDPVVVNRFSPSQEAITHPSTVAKNLPISGKLPGVGGVLFNGAFNSNPELAKAFGKGPASTITEPAAPTTPEIPRTIYQPTYAQYSPVNKMDTDSYGNPLFHNGGSIGE